MLIHSVHSTSSATTNLNQATDPMSADMHRLDAVIQQHLNTHIGLVSEISKHIIGAGGKRIRPRLVLLFAQALGYQGEHHFNLAATVEFIHTATLLHDDVVDESMLRRGRKTANAIFGDTPAVLVGDFLYARAFEMMVDTHNQRVLEVLADATNVIAEGEVLQMLNMHDPDIAVENYLQVIRYKTAKLFEASARLGAVISGATTETEERCAQYGRALGTAFQLVDDLLDYDGDPSALGKNVGDDLREGKPTLPLLVAMTRGTATERALIRHAIEQGEVEGLPEIVSIVHKTGALDATRDAARKEAKSAAESIFQLPPSIAKDLLLEFSARSVDRSF
jgi:octaprenyl-diphosphate synthase